jgi:protease-4
MQRVASGRHQTTAAIDEIAQGRVWAGSDALRLHLIDRLGTYDDAVHAAAQRARMGKGYEVRVIEPELGFMEQVLLNMRGNAVRAYRALGLGEASDAMVAVHLSRQLEPLERELTRWQRFAAVPNHTLAYCFCTPD